MILPRIPSIHAPLEPFLAQCNRREYPARSLLINAGEENRTLYYLMKGSVAVTIDGDDDHEMIMAYLNEGDFFGETGLFDDETNKGEASVRAKTACVVAEISYDRFRELVASDSELLFRVFQQTAERLRRTTRKAVNLAFLDVTGRIAATLLDLCKQPDAMTHPDGMQIRITRQDIGRIVGCSREMAGRVLKSLEEQNLISVSGKTIVVFGTR